MSLSTISNFSYYMYFIAMLNSLRENLKTDYKVIVFIDYLDDPYKEMAKKIYQNIEFREIDVQLYIDNNKNLPGWYCLEAFSLYEYDKVLSLDIDFICNNDISSIFDYDCDIGMVKELTGIYNGGLVLIGEKYLNKKTYEMLVTSDHENIKIGGNRDNYSKDQKLYNYFFNENITELPMTYNHLTDNYAIESKMIHYIYKPLYPTGIKRLNDIGEKKLIKLWLQHFNEAILNGQ